MKKLYYSVILALSCMLVACNGAKQFEALMFSTYEKEETVTSQDGAYASIVLKIDIPDGESERAGVVKNIIRTLITSSQISEEIGAPKEGTLQEVCDDYVERFKKGIADGDLGAGCEYHLEILHGLESEEYICFHVADGIFGNGGPTEREVVFRLSDQHQMEEGEMYNLPEEKWLELARKFAEGDEKETLQDVESLMSRELVPDEKGCKLHYSAVGVHIFNAVYFPASEIAQYLTDEGKKIFALEEVAEAKADSTEVKEEPVVEAPKAEPGRGELGIFDLRGPVKSCKWKRLYQTNTYTFDENGFWLTQDGQKLKKVYAGGIERDKKGRITMGAPDEFYGISYTYNDKGMIKETFCDGVTSTFTYDDDGYVKKEHVNVAPEMGDEEGESAEEYTLNYTILEKDEVGNWTKRKCSKGTETRTIEYYQ